MSVLFSMDISANATWPRNTLVGCNGNGGGDQEGVVGDTGYGRHLIDTSGPAVMASVVSGVVRGDGIGMRYL